MSEAETVTQTSYLDGTGIDHAAEIFYNLSYRDLYLHETSTALPEHERARLTTLGAVCVDTGRYTGRSPKDKYVVRTSAVADDIWWSEDGSDNQPMSLGTWAYLKDIAVNQLTGKKLYVMDGFCGANPATRLAVRLVTEVSWMAHFFKNMFIRPKPEELEDFEPSWTILHACKAQCADFAAHGLNSETFVSFHLGERMTVIGGTWYSGEIKKGIFSVMNYLLPKAGIGSFHCSANQGESGDTALFFGLSGTGKTTLSTDPKRSLIGDDEHGWDNDGVFNLEGGCYAKTINLSEIAEPDIYRAIKRDALLENVALDGAGHVDFTDSSKTENTRVSYPIYHIHRIVKPRSAGGHPKRVIFLTCDAYGVLPPVSCLNKSQAMYQFLSGYTAKVAGTELGVKEPTACFSACFGQPFLLMHPTRYAEILGQKMDEHGAQAYLVNTGWSGGPYGEGHRVSIQDTRGIIDAILSGAIDDAKTVTFPYFGFAVPTTLPGVDSRVLVPRETWSDVGAYDEALVKLAEAFAKNFEQYLGNAFGQELSAVGPVVD